MAGLIRDHRRSFPALAFGEAAPVGEGHNQPDWSVESALLRHRWNQSRMFDGEMAEGCCSTTT